MAYDLVPYATDGNSVVTNMSEQDIILGLPCGPIQVGQLNFLFKQIFTDLKTIHDQDDFLEGLSFAPVTGNANRFVLTADLNEVEDSVDLAVGFKFAAPLKIEIENGDLKWTLDIDALIAGLTDAQLNAIGDKLFANDNFLAKFTEQFAAHISGDGTNLKFANSRDASGNPDFSSSCP